MAIFFSGYPGSLSAQQPRISFEHFTSEHGLSAPVTQIIQDQYGFLWLGTTDGLNRFDGKNFVVYRNIPGDSSSLPNNIINALVADNHGRVWIASNGGLCFYDYADDAFHQIAFDASQEKIDQYRVHAVCISSDQSIWFATRSMLHHFSDDKAIETYPLTGPETLLIKYILADSQGRVWIGYNGGIAVFDRRTNHFITGSIQSPFSIANKLAITVHPIVHFQNDTMLIGSWYAGLQKVFIEGDTIGTILFPDDIGSNPRRHIVSGISKGAGSQWWAGTYGSGIAWFDVHANKFTAHFQHDAADAKSLSDDYVKDVFTDASGIVWIGTAKGLDKFDPLTQQFTSISIPLAEDDFSVYKLVNTIVEDNQDPNSLWLCVSGAGLYHYDKSKQKFELYKLGSEISKQFPSNNIYSFYYDRKGIVWVGTISSVLQFDTKTRRFMDSPLFGSKNVKGVHTILQDKYDHYWFATHSNGIFKYDAKKDSLTAFTYKTDDPGSLPDNKIFCMLYDDQGYIWAGTQNKGLCRLDPATNEILQFQADKSKPNSLPDNGVYDLYSDNENTLWIATENGFASMNMINFECKTYMTQHGLCNNTVFSITRDHTGQLWLGTNNGLSHFNPETKQFRNYYVNDGLPVNRIDGEVFFSSDNTLYLGTTGMITYCHPESMKMNKRVPSILITDFSILGKKVPVMREKEMLQPIHLSHKQNMITFNFAALNFTNPFLNQYAYKMEGFDEDWIHAGNAQSATYTNLNGGTYIFRVKGANNDGIWNETGSHVTVIVHPPFWKTWWFYLLCSLAIAGIFYTYYRIRINQLIRLQSIRAHIARDLHDDIGSTLSSIHMISSMADGSRVSNHKTSELFHTISSASGQAMELMGDIVWSINPKNDSMEMIIIRMRQYASEILEAADIHFAIEIDEAAKNILLPLEIRKNFYLIYKEAINNLAKYSNAQKATIRLRYEHHSIYLMISDDGVGFDPSIAASGNGLMNMRSRAEQLKGSILINSTTGVGTRIDLYIPLLP